VNLLWVLLGLHWLIVLGKQLLQVLNRTLQLFSLSLTCLELPVPLMQLSLEVVDVVLGDNQLIMSVLQPSVGVVKEASLEVMAAMSPHQLVV
jgi:hypothetical protein